MVDNSVANTARLVVLLVAPEGAPLLEAAIQILDALCTHLKEKARQRNRELLELLEAFKFRISSEEHEGRDATDDWMTRFGDLFSSIREHVSDSKDISKFMALRTAKSDATKVAAFRQAMDELYRSIAFD